LGFCIGAYAGVLYNQNDLKVMRDSVLGFILLSFGMFVGIIACYYLPLGVVIVFCGICVSAKILTDAPLKVSLSAVKKDVKELFSDEE